MTEYNVLNIRNFGTVSTKAESPELALIQLHAETMGDVKQVKYNEYLKNICYNGNNIGLGNFVFMAK